MCSSHNLWSKLLFKNSDASKEVVYFQSVKFTRRWWTWSVFGATRYYHLVARMHFWNRYRQDNDIVKTKWNPKTISSRLRELMGQKGSFDVLLYTVKSYVDLILCRFCRLKFYVINNPVTCPNTFQPSSFSLLSLFLSWILSKGVRFMLEVRNQFFIIFKVFISQFLTESKTKRKFEP